MNKKILYSVIGVIALGLIVPVLIGANVHDTPQQATASPAPVQSPAYKLAVADFGHEPSTPDVAKYQSALDYLKPLCTEDEASLASEIWASWKDLVSNKVTDESNLSLMAHVAQSVPASAAPTDCRGVMASYLLLREQNVK